MSDDNYKKLIESLSVGKEWLMPSEPKKSGIQVQMESMQRKVYIIKYDDTPSSIKFILDEEYEPKNLKTVSVTAFSIDEAKEAFELQKPNKTIIEIGEVVTGPGTMEIDPPEFKQDKVLINAYYQPKVSLPDFHTVIKIKPV